MNALFSGNGKLGGTRQTVAPITSRAEASGIVEADGRDLFHFTDWCYNVPTWFLPVRKTWITELPDSAGLGKVTHYVGHLMGREMEWEAESVEWKENELWMMRAITGPPARMNMQLELRFEAAGPGKTRVTCAVGYRVPYPLIGSLIDRFYLRHEARRLANDAIEGMKRAADRRKVPPVAVQLEKREADHPGYTIVSESPGQDT